MNLDEIKSKYNLSQQSTVIAKKIMEKKGQFCHLSYKRPLKFRKEFEESNYGYKQVEGTFRLGIDYEELGVVQEKREQGITASGLKGKQWQKFPWFLEGANNTLLLRVYTARNTKSTTTFVLNGKEVSVEELEPFCLKSELDLRPHLTSFDINFNYIYKIY